MKKLIKLDFNNTTKERKTEDSYSELYSYDKNNGSFEFEILNDTLTTEQVIALFKFTESNKVWKTTGTVEGNKVHVTFDTTLITQNETVICYLYFDEEQRTSDTFRFKFKVKVSEIDKMSRYEVKERFINNTVIVDRLDVVTKTELQEALKNVGGVATEGLLTEVKAEEIYVKKTELPTPYNDSALVSRVQALENRPTVDTTHSEPTSQSEMRGTGMPNGVVEAPIGATYIDTAKTNGALKWIKTTDSGNTDWKVVEGDTGWLTVFKEEHNKNTLKIRRVNNMVNVSFYCDLTGVDSILFKKINNNVENLATEWIGSGFNPETEILLPAFNDFRDIAISGVESIGVCRFDIVENMLVVDVVTNKNASSITLGINKLNFTYSTYDEWPVQLP